MMEPGWLGRRVSVRRVVDHLPDGQARLGDVVGDLLSLDGGVARIDGRRGEIAVPLDDVVLARLAPPSTADELALEGVAAAGWLPAETGAVGGWLLRAAGGFTNRANSVLPLRAPGRPLDEALAAAGAWYAERGLPLRLQVPIEARRLLDAELGERGWPASPDVHVLAARLDMLSASPRHAVLTVTMAAAPDDGWLAVYRGGAGATSPAAFALLTRHERAGFASIRDGDRVVALGRGVVNEDWLGISALEVIADLRRQGLGTALMAALWAWGSEQGARRSYLQVASDNAAALALYRCAGYWHHHDYRYRTESDTPPNDQMTV